MNFKTWGSQIGLFLLILMSLQSCANKKKLTRKPTVQQADTMSLATKDTAAEPLAESGAVVKISPPAENPVPEEATAKIKKEIMTYRNLWSQKIAPKTFQGKAGMSYEGRGDKQEFTANFRIIKDQKIWVSITALGGIVNVARALITPDSIGVILYLDKSYYLMSINEAGKILPSEIDFQTLQNLIFGNPLLDRNPPDDFVAANQMLNFLYTEQDVEQYTLYHVADQLLHGNQLNQLEGGQSKISINLEAYEKTGNYQFSKNRTIKILSEGQEHLVKMNFRNVEFDQTFSTPFNIPNHYTLKQP